MLRELLEDLLCGRKSAEEVEKLLQGYSVLAGGGARLDIARTARCGLPEVIYGPGKPDSVLAAVVEEHIRSGLPLFVSRASKAQADLLLALSPKLKYDDVAAAVYCLPDAEPCGMVSVVCAGSADLPVAGEACVALRFFGVGHRLIADVGVSGIHRLADVVPELNSSDAVIVAAGMEGALPSVVGGLISPPVIGVPVSVGYGAALGGFTALLAMLSTCSPGVCVVNIDNGVGAAAVAARIVRSGKRIPRHD